MIIPFLVVAALAAAPPPGAPPHPPGHGGDERQFWPDARNAVNYDFLKRAKALRQELTALKQADGGVLTPEHLALMQAKLEDLLASYERDLDRLDPMSHDGGSARH